MTSINKIENIIWDWNGTILNDVELCISCMNKLLAARKLKMLNRKRYLDVFTFPVKKYYIQLGFDFDAEPFEKPAEAFIDYYTEGLAEVLLYDDVRDSLSFFQSRGLQQFIVSAMKDDSLRACVAANGLSGYFKDISGIQDNLAFGKTEIARQLISRYDLDTTRTIMIGDTLHDAEIAKELNITCFLVAGGHQSSERLKKSKNKVFPSLKMLVQSL